MKLVVHRLVRNPCLSHLFPCQKRKVSSRGPNGGAHSYFQGQYSQQGRREYFYYIDHQGMLFLDDAKMKNFTSCFKEKKFLKFFFSRLKINDSGFYSQTFPYLSPCGPEHNYIRCEYVPIVFTHVLDDESEEPLLSFNHADRFLSVPFEPSKICMNPDSGCVYHPAKSKSGGVGLLADKLSLEWTKEKRFIFGDGEDKSPTGFVWNSSEISLSNELLPKILEMESNRK